MLKFSLISILSLSMVIEIWSSFPHGGLPTPNLSHFAVHKLLPDRMHTLTALQYLRISGIPSVESFAEGGLPPNLQSFQIDACEKLRPSVEHWGLQRLVSLRTFHISQSEDVLETVLKEQLLPTTLHTLQISVMESLKSLEGKGLQHLTSLHELQIRWCDSLEFLPKEGLPASLSCLRIYICLFSDEEVSGEDGRRVEQDSSHSLHPDRRPSHHLRSQIKVGTISSKSNNCLLT